MATFLKFDCFVENVAEKVHNLGADTLMVLLTNTSPVAGDTVVDTVSSPCIVKAVSNGNEVAAGFGYTKKGNQATITSSAQTAGLYKLVLADPATWTAVGGSIGPFRYVVLYNDSGGAAATRPVIGWWDYGSSITLAAGETFTADMDPTTGVLTIQQAMILATTTQSLEIDLAGAITTNQLPFSVEFTEVTASTFTPGHQDGQSNGTTAVTILTAPGAGSTYRIVRHINVYNKDTVAATVTIQFNNAATLRELIVITLQAGQTLTWSTDGGWQVLYVQAATDTVPGIIEIAIQSEMEAGTDVVRAVVPGRLQFHPAACKCWGKAVGAGTSLTVSYNITSVSDTGTGRLGVTIATDFSSANYSIVAQIERGVTALTVADVEQCAIRNASPAAGTFEIESYDHTSGTLVADDPANYFWECYGDQA